MHLSWYSYHKGWNDFCVITNLFDNTEIPNGIIIKAKKRTLGKTENTKADYCISLSAQAV